MSHIKNIKGFTLVELIVIIAIIGILATVTYANVSSARDRAKDKSIASSMQSILIEANLYHSNNGSYAGFCVDTATNMDELLADITAKAPSAPTCEDEASKFGVIVEQNMGDYYCVDSSKAFAETTHASLASRQCNF
jgi:prepilin-type N-terminal cleavage/methylation domain-containing protein